MQRVPAARFLALALMGTASPAGAWEEEQMLNGLRLESLGRGRATIRRGWRQLALGLAGACLVPVRAPAADRHGGHHDAVAVLAGGCYWGVESVFRHVRGIKSVTSGYAMPVPAAALRSTERAEAVRIVYDSSSISYRRILDVFFSVVHDPTELDRQGPDVGPEYRSVVFVADSGQRGEVRAYIDSLSAAHVFPGPIVTEIAGLQSFQAVDASQQDYAERHPTDPYIMTNDVPKLAALHRLFPQLYRI